LRVASVEQPADASAAVATRTAIAHRMRSRSHAWRGTVKRLDPADGNRQDAKA
jgi:hypothetical protein